MLLSGYRLAVIGGDRRETVAARLLADAGARVRRVDADSGDQQLAASGAHAVIYPVRGIDDQGNIAGEQGYGPLIFDDQVVSKLRSDSVIIIGSANRLLHRAAQLKSRTVVELMSCDQFSILNAIPTAEGAIAAAVQAMPITLHDCPVLVVGYGRCGREVADRLRALGARTLVAARSTTARAGAHASGHDTTAITVVADHVLGCKAIFNTVPAPVLGADVLARAAPGCFLFELASAPGGFDREAAIGCELPVIDLPGLPGKVAPESAGRYLAQAAAAVITDHIPTPT